MTLLLLLAACSSPPEKDPARPFEYQIWFSDDQVGLQTEIHFQGEVVGKVQQHKDFTSGTGKEKRSFGKVTLPMNWSEDPEARLSLVSSTPCGPVETPLELEKKPTATILLKTPSVSDLPASSVVYHRHEGAVSIGQAELKSSRGGWAVSGLKCAAEHEIKVDGKRVGTMKAPDETAYVFLSDGPEHCYNVTWAVYAKENGGSFDLLLEDAWAYGMTHELYRLFEAAPDAIRTYKTSAEMGVSRRYLTEVECPAG